MMARIGRFLLYLAAFVVQQGTSTWVEYRLNAQIESFQSAAVQRRAFSATTCAIHCVKLSGCDAATFDADRSTCTMFYNTKPDMLSQEGLIALIVEPVYRVYHSSNAHGAMVEDGGNL